MIDLSNRSFYTFWTYILDKSHCFICIFRSFVAKMKNMKHYLRNILFCVFLLGLSESNAQKHWTAADGLPTGEVRQIVELPNGQMLVNCEGIFCISNGQSFDEVPFDQNWAYQLPQYIHNYGHVWQGDSLLWLHDFYRVYLFDVHKNNFCSDIHSHLNDTLLKSILLGHTISPSIATNLTKTIDSIHVRDVTMSTTDRQGGLWFGLRTKGIVYLPPQRNKPQLHTGNDPIIGMARSATMRNGLTTFVVPLPDGRMLRCDSLHNLSYILPDNGLQQPLSNESEVLRTYRYMVGACPLDEQWVAIYTQNGIFMLDTKTDTLATFPCTNEMERYSNKYSCMLKDEQERLWIGTQNGLYCLTSASSRKEINEYRCQRIQGLANNCIRSLVLDADGNVWTGTSLGISRITPTVINLGVDEGIPATAMMDRSAILLNDGRLAFAIESALGISFYPSLLIKTEEPLPVVLTRIKINGMHVRDIPYTVPYTQNHFTFQFSTLNYAAPSHDQYRYRLYGIEDEWNTISNSNGQCITDYQTLPPGDYTFEVQAANASGKWGDVTRLSFTICPPWWLTWWAKILYGIMGLSIFIVLTNIYLRRHKEQIKQEYEQRVNRLFELREDARHHFAESARIDPNKISVNTEEEKFVTAMLKAIEKNMDNEQYNATLLARDVAMSRASLYSRLHTMLGITPTDFIRNVRLKRAAQLLTETTLPINEIAYRVGFVTARNFSTQFKKAFGVLPSYYRGEKSMSSTFI